MFRNGKESLWATRAARRRLDLSVLGLDEAFERRRVVWATPRTKTRASKRVEPTGGRRSGRADNTNGQEKTLYRTIDLPAPQPCPMVFGIIPVCRSASF